MSNYVYCPPTAPLAFRLSMHLNSEAHFGLLLVSMFAFFFGGFIGLVGGGIGFLIAAGIAAPILAWTYWTLTAYDSKKYFVYGDYKRAVIAYDELDRAHKKMAWPVMKKMAELDAEGESFGDRVEYLEKLLAKQTREKRVTRLNDDSDLAQIKAYVDEFSPLDTGLDR